MLNQTVTSSELEGLRARWQPAPRSQMDGVMRSLAAAVGQRDALKTRLQELGTEARALEAQRAAATAAGDVDALSGVVARLTAVNDIRTAVGQTHALVGSEIGAMAAELERLIMKLRSAEAEVERSAAALARYTDEHEGVVAGLEAHRAAILGAVR